MTTAILIVVVVVVILAAIIWVGELFAGNPLTWIQELCLGTSEVLVKLICGLIRLIAELNSDD